MEQDSEDGMKCKRGEVDDMVSLNTMSDTLFHDNIQARYMQKNIYTYVGPMLISVNPWDNIPGLYSGKTMELYIASKHRNEQKPHLYGVSNESYSEMAKEQKNQSILISGESGAGKTEATKLIIQFLTYATTKDRHRGIGEIETQLLNANPLLESFGNAKTNARGNTLFSLFLPTHVQRVVYQSNGERNYHVFYQLCKGASDTERAALKLMEPERFQLLTKGNCCSVGGMNDAENFIGMKQSMSVIGISKVQQDYIFTVIAAILHLGNITFDLTKEKSALSPGDTAAATAAYLLKLETHNIESALCNRPFQSASSRKSAYSIPLKPKESIDSRDALCKELYKTLFEWLVDKVNEKLTKNIQNVPATTFLGILDIFGFEMFENNSFEQFCVNYCNEKLQLQFSESMLKCEQLEYIKERIQWNAISFNDNTNCINLIEGKPLGIISILDEEGVMPNGNDRTFLTKVIQHNASNPHFRTVNTNNTVFVIRHYAADVTYNVIGFLDKNKDTLYPHLINMLQKSQHPFIQELFPRGQRNRKAAGAATGTSARLGGNATIGSQFKMQLRDLYNTLNSTDVHYIRCLKPNAGKTNGFDRDYVLHQLKCCGILEAIKIRRQGFSHRFTYSQFYYRYRLLVANSSKAPREFCEWMLQKISKVQTYQMGVSKVFLKEEQYKLLETLRERKMLGNVIAMQSIIRGIYAKKIYKKLKIEAERRREEERRRREEEERRRREEEERRRRLEEERRRREEEERRMREEAERRRIEEEERRRRDDERRIAELKRREEEDRRRRLGEEERRLIEQKRREEEERKRKILLEADEQRWRQVEEEDRRRKQAEEAERQRLEEERRRKADLKRDPRRESLPMEEERLVKEADSLFNFVMEAEKKKKAEEDRRKALDGTDELNIELDRLLSAVFIKDEKATAVIARRAVDYVKKKLQAARQGSSSMLAEATCKTMEDVTREIIIATKQALVKSSDPSAQQKLQDLVNRMKQLNVVLTGPAPSTDSNPRQSVFTKPVNPTNTPRVYTPIPKTQSEKKITPTPPPKPIGLGLERTNTSPAISPSTTPTSNVSNNTPVKPSIITMNKTVSAPGNLNKNAANNNTPAAGRTFVPGIIGGSTGSMRMNRQATPPATPNGTLRGNGFSSNQTRDFLEAVKLDNLQLLDELLRTNGGASVDINAKDENGFHALHWACRNGSLRCVNKLLSDSRILVNVKDNAGWTALHYACSGGLKEILEALLSHPRIDTDIVNKQGKKPVELIKSRELVALFKNHKGATMRDAPQPKSFKDTVKSSTARESLTNQASSVSAKLKQLNPITAKVSTRTTRKGASHMFND